MTFTEESLQKAASVVIEDIDYSDEEAKWNSTLFKVSNLVFYDPDIVLYFFYLSLNKLYTKLLSIEVLANKIILLCPRIFKLSYEFPQIKGKSLSSEALDYRTASALIAETEVSLNNSKETRSLPTNLEAFTEINSLVINLNEEINSVNEILNFANEENNWQLLLNFMSSYLQDLIYSLSAETEDKKLKYLLALKLFAGTEFLIHDTTRLDISNGFPLAGIYEEEGNVKTPRGDIISPVFLRTENAIKDSNGVFRSPYTEWYLSHKQKLNFELNNLQTLIRADKPSVRELASSCVSICHILGLNSDSKAALNELNIPYTSPTPLVILEPLFTESLKNKGRDIFELLEDLGYDIYVRDITNFNFFSLYSVSSSETGTKKIREYMDHFVHSFVFKSEER